MESINRLFSNLMVIATGVVVSVAIFVIAIGAFQYMSAAGNPHQMERGKTTIVSALFGMAVVLSARVIVESFGASLGGTTA